VISSAYLSVTLFLLTADQLFVDVGGLKIKFGYFLLAGLWFFDPAAMFRSAGDALRRLPKFPLLLLIPATIAVVTSVNMRSSIGWALWLGFDAFTIITVYAFLNAQRFAAWRIQDCAAYALGLVAFFGIVQFVCIFVLGRPIFDPQFNRGMYRLNGLSGWPHFLNIYAFLLLPLVLTRHRIGLANAAITVALIFVLVQSTAKTGWLLFAVLSAMLLVFSRRVLLKKLLMFVVPVAVVVMLVPFHAFDGARPVPSGLEKIERFGDGLAESTSVRDRLLINEMGIRVWARHPWFGVGPRAYDAYVFSRFDAELPGQNKASLEHAINAKNENIWIEFLAEAGIFFTLGFIALVIRALWVTRWQFANSLHLGAWIALVMYFTVSGQVSQTGLLTLVYAVFGIYFHAREQAAR